MNRHKIILNKKKYVIFENKNQNNLFSYDRLRYHLEKYKLTEISIQNGHCDYIHFLWFRYINEINGKLTNKYLNNQILIINDILGVECITNKYFLSQNIKKYFSDECDKIIPKTGLFTKELIFDNKIKILKPIKNLKTNIVISSSDNIIICETNDDFEFYKHIINDYDYIVSQDYILNPHLFNKKKYHVRIYLLITIIDNIFNSYTIKYGKIIVARDNYPLTDCDTNNNYKNVYQHLSKYIFNDNDYEFPNDLNTENNINDKNIIENIWIKIQDILVKLSVILSDNIYQHKNTKHSFHLFGLDFMLTNNYDVKLLEVNRYPCLTTKFDKNKKNNLEENLFNLIDDVVLKPIFLNKKKFIINELLYTKKNVIIKKM
jgi:hypothetical protein